MNNTKTARAFARLEALAADLTQTAATRRGAAYALADLRRSCGQGLASYYLHQVEAVAVFSGAGLSVDFTHWQDNCSATPGSFCVFFGNPFGMDTAGSLRGYRWYRKTSAKRAARILADYRVHIEARRKAAEAHGDRFYKPFSDLTTAARLTA